VIPRARCVAAALVVAALAGSIVAAQSEPGTFRGTASVRKGAATASAPVSVTVTRYATVPERELVRKAIREGGGEALREALSRLPDTGFIHLGERRTRIKFAEERVTASGRLVTVVTAEPILFLGAGIPAPKSQTGFDVAVALLDMADDGTGLGELAPAARVGLDEGGALLIQDYGATVVWIKDLTRAK
jgi:hypothetical protein